MQQYHRRPGTAAFVVHPHAVNRGESRAATDDVA
jgi:hypothetical protein